MPWPRRLRCGPRVPGNPWAFVFISGRPFLRCVHPSIAVAPYHNGMLGGSWGCEFYYTDLQSEDRRAVEAAFRAGVVMILCATPTLAPMHCPHLGERGWWRVGRR